MKLKNTLKGFGKYFREVSVVIVGIAITFTLSDWIGSRNERKDLERYLGMVKIELEGNLEIVNDQFDFYDRTGKFAKYLLSVGKQENLQADSLAKYDDIMKNLKSLNYEASAFEMLKSSGTMRLIKDKQMLKSIITSYNLLKYTQGVGDRAMEIKQKELYGTIMENGISEAGYDIANPKYRRVFNYFSAYSAIEGNFRSCIDQLKKTLEMF